MTANLDQFLSHSRVAKRQGNKAVCYCPAHDDKHSSLNFTLDREKILGHCFAGCEIADILQSVNLKLADLFLNGAKPPQGIYQYHDSDGGFLCEKLKYRNKDGSKHFKQRRLAPDGRILYNLQGMRCVPYNYLGVIAAIKKGETIVWPEGEKDAETARIIGYAHTTMGGASDWKWEKAP